MPGVNGVNEGELSCLTRVNSDGQQITQGKSVMEKVLEKGVTLSSPLIVTDHAATDRPIDRPAHADGSRNNLGNKAGGNFTYLILNI